MTFTLIGILLILLTLIFYFFRKKD
ncbi:LPXTG cell wall anchor domain-containing protein [Pseudopedobacter saltans]